MNKTVWIVVALIGIVVVLFAGLLPLPGQKDNQTPQSQQGSPGVPAAPQGPREIPATGAEALKQQPVK